MTFIPPQVHSVNSGVVFARSFAISKAAAAGALNTSS